MSKVRTLSQSIPKLNYFDIQASLHVVYDPKCEYFRVPRNNKQTEKFSYKSKFRTEEEFLDQMSLQHAKKN